MRHMMDISNISTINISGSLSDLLKGVPKNNNLDNYESLLHTFLQKPITRQGKIVGVITGIDISNDYWEGIMFTKLLPELSMDNCFCEVVLKDI